MIFPPNLGQQAGTQAAVALLGFIITDARSCRFGNFGSSHCRKQHERPDWKSRKKDRNLFDPQRFIFCWGLCLRSQEPVLFRLRSV